MIGYFNGHDQTMWVMAQGLVQTLLIRLPLAYYMSIQPNASLTNIGFAAPVATIFWNCLKYRILCVDEIKPKSVFKKEHSAVCLTKKIFK